MSENFGALERRTMAHMDNHGMFDGLKMSSREIARVTRKEHFHVRRDIKVLIDQGAIIESNFGVNEFKVKVGFGFRTEEEYILDFKASMVLITGYDAVRRAAVIDRWMELEEGKATPAFKVPQTMAEALRLAADLAEENQMLLQVV